MPIQPGPESTFAQQFQQFMTYAGPIMQLAFWTGMLVLALLAYVQLKRLVDAKIAAYTADPRMGHGGMAAGTVVGSAPGGAGTRGADDISVEDFAD